MCSFVLSFLGLRISLDCLISLFILFLQVTEGEGLAAQARHDHDSAAADHRHGVHPLQHRQGRLQPLRGLPGEQRNDSSKTVATLRLLPSRFVFFSYKV